MRVDLFDFDLPRELIALRPARPRAMPRACSWCATTSRSRIAACATCRGCCARAMCWCSTIPASFPAQLEGRRGEARIGATLHKRIDLRRWQAFIRNAKRLRVGDIAEFGGGVTALAEDRLADGSFVLAFEGEEPVEVLLERAGRMPLPPYIAGKRATDARDREDYQTMFAAEDGAVAAPTASTAFHPRPDCRAGCSGRRTRNADAACRGGDFPAGEGRRYRRSRDAFGMGSDRGRYGASASTRRARPEGGSSRSVPPACACSKAPRVKMTSSGSLQATPTSSLPPAIASARSTG